MRWFVYESNCSFRYIIFFQIFSYLLTILFCYQQIHKWNNYLCVHDDTIHYAWAYIISISKMNRKKWVMRECNRRKNMAMMVCLKKNNNKTKQKTTHKTAANILRWPQGRNLGYNVVVNVCGSMGFDNYRVAVYECDSRLYVTDVLII